MANPLISLPLDISLAGTLTVQNKLNMPNGTVGAAQIVVAPAPGKGLPAASIIQMYKTGYWNPAAVNSSGTLPTTDRRPLDVGYGQTGTLLAYRATLMALITGAGNITVDLYKNNASILSSVIILNNTPLPATPRAMVSAAGFTSSAFVAGDLFEVVVTVTGAITSALGLYAALTYNEDPS